MPLNNTGKNVALDGLDESVVAGVTFIGIHTLVDPGTGTNANAGEATGGAPAYIRKAVVWGAASAGQKTNSGTLTFDVPAGMYGFFTLWNAVSGNTNNFMGHLPFRGNPASAVQGFGTVDAVGLGTDNITSAAHGLTNTRRVMVFNVFAESLPGGLVEGTIYFVVGATADTFQVSLTSGGAAVDLTSIGELYFQEVVPEIFAGQGTITAGAGALLLDAQVI